MWGKVLIITIIAFGIYLTFCSPKKHCACGVKIPEGGGMCECGEYYHKAVNESFHRMVIRREEELKRIEEEKKNGNDYDTFL